MGVVSLDNENATYPGVEFNAHGLFAGHYDYFVAAAHHLVHELIPQGAWIIERSSAREIPPREESFDAAGTRSEALAREHPHIVLTAPAAARRAQLERRRVKPTR